LRAAAPGPQREAAELRPLRGPVLRPADQIRGAISFKRIASLFHVFNCVLPMETNMLQLVGYLWDMIECIDSSF
jgi:hypothetical protein